jgi:hypothetical protein
MALSWSDRSSKLKTTPKLRSTRRLELEVLEDRWVPSAIRDLPGFHANRAMREAGVIIPSGHNDDGSSPFAFNVGFTMNFFGTISNSVFVNNNGNVTFNEPLATASPFSLASDANGIPIIAPFFADVDTRVLTQQVVTWGLDTLCGRAAFGVDYFNVNYFDATAGGHIDKFNTFQLILVDRSDTGPGNFDIEFNYQMIPWESGDPPKQNGTNGLGGNSAAVGFSNGTGIPGTFFELPGSHIPGSFIDGGTTPLNQIEILSSTPGRIHFLVREGQVVNMEGVNVDFTGNLRLFSPFRLLLNPTNGVEFGNLTLCNIGGVLQPSPTDQCLDITPSGTVGAISGPITILFTGLPPGTTLANPTGFTASGIPFITVQTSPISPGGCIRITVEFNNPNLIAETTFFGGPITVQIIAGTFDPTTL